MFPAAASLYVVSFVRPKIESDVVDIIREARYLELTRSTSDPDVRERLVAIARHYRSLAKIEQSIADQRPNKSVAANPHHFAMTEFTSVQQ